MRNNNNIVIITHTCGFGDKQKKKDEEHGAEQSRDNVVVIIAAVGLHVEVRGGATTEFVNDVDDLDLHSVGALGIKVAFNDDFVKGGEDDITEVGMGEVKGEGKKR